MSKYIPLIKKILLIEDDEDDYVIVRSFCSEITSMPLELEWVDSYEQALQQVLQQQHDLYLVDYLLGPQSGIDFIQQAVASGCTTPMILLTGQGDREIDLAAMNAGAADYLVKNEINAQILERTIRYTLERSRTLDELRQTSRENVQLASAIANITTGVVITDPALPDNPIIFINPAFTEITGYSATEVLGHNCRFLQGPKTDRATIAEMRLAIAERRSITCTLLNYRKDGTPFWNELTINPIFDADGHLVNFVGLQTDVTGRKRAEEALRDSEERYALAVRGANDGIWDWNLKTDEIYFSDRWKAMLGYGESAISNTLGEWFSRIHPEDLDWFKLRLTAHMDGLTPHFEHEHRMLHRDGRYRWMLSRGLAVWDTQGQATRMAGSQTDITERKQAEEQLLHDAFHDALTGLPNRALLMDRLRHALELTKRNPAYRFAVLFLDIDHFKMINDSLGHAVGDRLLMAIAQRLASCLRPGDTIARLGGDEFVILLEDLKDMNEPTHLADRTQLALTQPFMLKGQEIFTTASIGIAFSTLGYEWSEDVLRDADTAMYRAKAQGRARHEIFNMGMHISAVALLQLQTDLRWALDRHEFQLHYQPIVNLHSGRIAGFEALLRWQHPERGMVSPTEFIPLAEETGLIVPIGHWVLREACNQMKVWQTQFLNDYPLTISVNLSAKQFTPNLIDQIAQILQETRLDPACLKLEITESVLMDNADSAATMLAQLHSMGIQLSMDDFGTGYSSLSYLHRFPVDTLKIDRSFINKIDVDVEQLAIVRTIITLAWNLGMDIVAEGIETAKQLAQMRALKCEYGQGYYFSPGMDSQTVERLITSAAFWGEQKYSA